MRAEAEQGFTLIEVLVALVMVATLLTVLGNGIASAGQRRQQTDEKIEAILLIRSVIAEASAASYSTLPALGENNGLAWSVAQTPLRLSNNGLFGLIQIEAEIRDHAGSLVLSMRTRRLKRLVPA